MKTPSRHIAPYVVAAAVAAFLIFLAYVMFFVPKLNETKALEDQTATVAASNEVLAAKRAIIKENAENIGSLEDRVDEFNAAFPPGSSQKELVAAVTKAASDSGVTLTTLNPAIPSVAMIAEEVPAEDAGTVETGEADVDAALESVQTDDGSAPVEEEGLQDSSVAMVALTINAQGRQEALRTFMQKLEKLDRPVMVKTFSFEGEGDKVNLSITSESFFVAPLANPEKAEESGKEEAAEGAADTDQADAEDAEGAAAEAVETGVGDAAGQ